MRLRSFLIGTSCLALLAACAPTDDTAETATSASETSAAEAAAPDTQSTEQADAGEQTETERLFAWFDEQFQEELDRSPLFKTYLGMIDDVEAYGEWDDVSEEAFRDSLAREAARTRYMHENFDYDALTHEGQVAWRFAEFIAANNAQQGEFWDHGYIFTQFFGPHTQLPTILIGYHRVDTVEHAEAYISRLNGLGDVIETYTAQADARAQAGVLAPAFAYPIVVTAARRFITGAPFDDSGEDSPLMADFRGKVEALDIDQAEKGRLIAEAEAALTTVVEPAYQRIIALFEEQAEVATDDDGVWKHPDGGEFYNYLLNNYTTMDLSAEEIHQLGLSEVERIHGEMRAIMDEVDFEGSLQDFFEFMRTDEQFYYPNTFPEAELEVRRVEPFRENAAGKAFYQRPAPNGTRPGVYYANLRDMADMPTYQMEALAYHEGIPGHHMQLAIMQELDGVPAFRRFGGYTAYTEGWGLYTEYLPKEFGFYSDPYSDFGRLAMELWRACRLVVDTGLHYHQWTRQEAVDYLLENTPNPEGDVRNAIDRYIVYPGQANAYKVGMLEILRLRGVAEEALGEAYDIRDFHDVVLTQGAMPLAVLEERVNNWIAETQAAE